MKIRIINILLGALLGLPLAQVIDHEQELHPDYDLMTIRPTHPNRDENGSTISVYGASGGEFSAPVLGMEWTNNRDDLLILTWRGTSGPESGGLTGNHPRDGRLFVIHDIRSQNRNNITGELIADNFKDAHGVKVVNGEIYVSDIDRVVRLVDNNNDGFYETHQLVGDLPAYDGWFEYAFGLVYQNNRFYIALASHVQLSGSPTNPLGPDRGTVISMDMNGNYQVVASGLRAPNGITANPAGDIFVTDNQGGWRPSSMFIHVQQGRNYGYQSSGNQYQGQFQNQPVTPPAVWAVHGPIAHGPTGPAYMPSGIFQGQFFAGDIGKGGIKRYFLEKINGEYQGAIFPFTGAMEVGIDRVIIDDDGTIFAGGVGNGGDRNQGWLGTRQGLQRLIRQNDNDTTFEILAVRSRQNGMELEFTKAVNNAAGNAGQYTVLRYQMVPSSGYGAGNMQNSTNLTITDVQVSPDRKKVYLEVANLQEDWVVEIRLAGNYQSMDGDDPWFDRAWYTLNNISPAGPFDILGCTTPGFAEYNPNATVDDGTCATPVSIVSRSWLGERIEMFRSGQTISVRLPAGIHSDLDVFDLTGRRVYSQSDRNHFEISRDNLEAGVYFFKVRADGHTAVRTFVMD